MKDINDLEPLDLEPLDLEPIDVEPVDVEPLDLEPLDLEPIDVEPVDVEKVEQETGYSMGKLYEDIGDVAGRVASMPGELYEFGKFAAREAGPEIRKIAEKPTEAAEAAALGATISPTTSAFVERAIAKLTPEFLGGMTPEEYRATYGDRALTDIAIQNIKKQEETTKEFPLTSAASKLLTSTAITAPAIAAAPAALTLPAASAAFGVLGAGEAAEKTALETGSTEKATREAGKTLATQAITDALTLGLGKTAKAAGKKVIEAAKDAPTSRTLRAFGASPEQIEELRKTTSITKAPERVAQVLDETGVLKPFRTKSQLIKRLDDTIETESQKLGNIAKEVSQEVKPEFVSKVVDDITKQVENQVLKKLAIEKGKVDFDDPIVKDITIKLKELRNIGEEGLTGEKLPTFEQLNNKRKDLGQAVKQWEPGKTTEHQQALRDLYGIVKENLDSVAMMTDKGSDFVSQNNKLSSLYAAKSLTDTKSPGAAQVIIASLRRRPLESIGTIGAEAAIAGTALGAAGLPGFGIAVPAIFGARKIGPSAIATAARKAEKVIRPSVKTTRQLLDTAEKAFPETYKKFSSAIENAKSRGASAISAANYILSQQYPEYREMMEKVDKEEFEMIDEDFLTDQDFE